jgi:hypothetical protein
LTLDVGRNHKDGEARGALGPDNFEYTVDSLLLLVPALHDAALRYAPVTLENQIKVMINYKTNPFVRCCGFLYYRYVANPDTLWAMFWEYLDDNESNTDIT